MCQWVEVPAGRSDDLSSVPGFTRVSFVLHTHCSRSVPELTHTVA